MWARCVSTRIVVVAVLATVFLVASSALAAIQIEVPIQLRARAQAIDPIPVGEAEARGNSKPVLLPLFRIGAKAYTRLPWAKPGALQRPAGGLELGLHLEYDLIPVLSGAGGIDGPQAWDTYSRNQHHSRAGASQMRQAWVGLGLREFGQLTRFSAGLMTSHWGMGLLANDGSGAVDRYGRMFNDPRGGDLVLRAQLSVGLGSKSDIVTTVIADKVQGDDILLTADELFDGPSTRLAPQGEFLAPISGDSANQVGAAVLVGAVGTQQIGIYVAHRNQTNHYDRRLDVTAVDLFAKGDFALPLDLALHLETELAYVFGTTTMGPSYEHRKRSVAHTGAAGQALISARRWGVVVDLLYASGDARLNDGSLTAFRTDPNFNLGLLLFDQVIAAQSARAVTRAADEMLSGYPAPDLERLASKGGITNAVVVFPKLVVHPGPQLELYQGVMLAFSAAPNADPLHTRLQGGVAANVFGHQPGRLYGIEVNMGAAMRFKVEGGEAEFRIELARLFPGSAFSTGGGRKMAEVSSARALLAFKGVQFAGEFR